MTRLAAACVFLLFPLIGQSQNSTKDSEKLLRTIENRYNRVQSLKLNFSETYAGFHRPAQTESGVLYLRKPGRMRWEYAVPEGKIFLSDGKDVFLYTPGDRRAEKSRLKQSEDMRAPLAFLLGKLDFSKEFKSFQMRAENDDIWIAAIPKSESLAYTGVEFLASPEGLIKRVRVTGQDQSKLDFTFTGEQQNVPVSAALFTFHPPPGVQVVEAGQ